MLDRRNFMLGATIAASGTTLPWVEPAATSQSSPIVLVHGAWAGGWIWRRMAPALAAKGFCVSTPTCTGVGERAHLARPEIGLSTWIEDIVSHIENEDHHGVVLAAAGLGGIVIGGVADRIPERLSKLVFIDALTAQNGESAFDQFPEEVKRARLRDIAELGLSTYMPIPVDDSLFSGAGASDRQWMKSRYRRQPLKTFTEKLQLNNEIGNGLPKFYIDCIDPPFKPLVEVKRKLRTSLHWNILEFHGGHDAMFSAPGELSNLIASL
jgi:pimeloyl-ACP methyl ester carboxylesterase